MLHQLISKSLLNLLVQVDHCRVDHHSIISLTEGNKSVSMETPIRYIPHESQSTGGELPNLPKFIHHSFPCAIRRRPPRATNCSQLCSFRSSEQFTFKFSLSADTLMQGDLKVRNNITDSVDAWALRATSVKENKGKSNRY